MAAAPGAAAVDAAGLAGEAAVVAAYYGSVPGFLD